MNTPALRITQRGRTLAPSVERDATLDEQSLRHAYLAARCTVATLCVARLVVAAARDALSVESAIAAFALLVLAWLGMGSVRSGAHRHPRSGGGGLRQAFRTSLGGGDYVGARGPRHALARFQARTGRPVATGLRFAPFDSHGRSHGRRLPPRAPERTAAGPV